MDDSFYYENKVGDVGPDAQLWFLCVRGFFRAAHNLILSLLSRHQPARLEKILAYQGGQKADDNHAACNDTSLHQLVGVLLELYDDEDDNREIIKQGLVLAALILEVEDDMSMPSSVAITDNQGQTPLHIVTEFNEDVLDGAANDLEELLIRENPDRRYALDDKHMRFQQLEEMLKRTTDGFSFKQRRERLKLRVVTLLCIKRADVAALDGEENRFARNCIEHYYGQGRDTFSIILKFL